MVGEITRSRYTAILAIPLISIPLASYVIHVFSQSNSPTDQRYNPLIGGIRIEAPIDDYVMVGTIGYVAKDDQGNVGIITAAHIVDYKTSNEVYQPTIGENNEIGKPTRIAEHIDAAFIPFPNSVPTILYVVDNTPKILTVEGYEDFYTVEFLVKYCDIDLFVCKTGTRTGTTCGKVIEALLNTPWLDYVLVVSITCRVGDSGSPVYDVDIGEGDYDGDYQAVLLGYLVAKLPYPPEEPRTPMPYAISVTGVIDELGVHPCTSFWWCP